MDVITHAQGLRSLNCLRQSNNDVTLFFHEMHWIAIHFEIIVKFVSTWLHVALIMSLVPDDVAENIWADLETLKNLPLSLCFRHFNLMALLLRASFLTRMNIYTMCLDTVIK